jgi:S-adenosylmethionine-dependent methyltransferase
MELTSPSAGAWRAPTEDGRSRLFTEYADLLCRGFLAQIGEIRYALTTKYLMDVTRELNSRRLSALDVGPGNGVELSYLAHRGWVVTAVDLMPQCCEMTRAQIESAAPGQPHKVIQGSAMDVLPTLDERFELVLCHNTLVYQEDVVEWIDLLGSRLSPGGLLSVVTLNEGAEAMRAGLQGRWKDCVVALETGEDPFYPPTNPNGGVRGVLEAISKDDTLQLVGWRGVGVFTDHLAVEPTNNDLKLATRAEWLAGGVEPYRSIARLGHIIARRTS